MSARPQLENDLEVSGVFSRRLSVKLEVGFVPIESDFKVKILHFYINTDVEPLSVAMRRSASVARSPRLDPFTAAGAAQSARSAETPAK